MNKWWIIAGAAVLVLAAGGTAYTYGGDPLRKGVDRDPRKLLPGFARKLERVFARMRAQGFKPMLWEGLRSEERAAQLAHRGTGIRLSMHTVGAAADIVNGNNPQNPWNAPTAFWDALGRAAEAEGLTWGGRFSRTDQPHVQAVPVHEQTAFLAATPGERMRWVT